MENILIIYANFFCALHELKTSIYKKLLKFKQKWIIVAHLAWTDLSDHLKDIKAWIYFRENFGSTLLIETSKV
jgi:hypothetical protein